jgi:hypothetical protein
MEDIEKLIENFVYGRSQSKINALRVIHKMAGVEVTVENTQKFKVTF